MSVKVMIGMPTTSQVRLQTVATVQEMIATTCEASEIRVVYQAGQPVEKVRNQLVEQFLDMPDYTHLLFVGANVSVPPEGLNRLLLLDAPIAAGIYPELRSRLSAADGTDRMNVTTSLGRYASADHRENPPATDAQRVLYRWHDAHELGEIPESFDAVGTGFCLIRRDVLETLDRPWFRTLVDAPANFVSDDIFFCRKAREAGFDIVGDPNVSCDQFKVLDMSRLEELFTDNSPGWPWADVPAAPQGEGQTRVMIATVGPDEWIEPSTSDFIFQQLSDPFSCVANVSYNFGVDWVRVGNQLFDEFLDRSNCSHLLMLGARVAPPADFLSRALGLQVPVAAGCYRILVDNEVFYDAGTIDDEGQATLLYDIDEPQRDRPREIDYVGLSATLMTRGILERLARPILTPADHSLAAAVNLCRRWADEAGVRPTLVPLPCRVHEELGLKALLDLKLRLRDQVMAAV